MAGAAFRESDGLEMNGRPTPCRRGCCWTPHGVCAKSGSCGCHMNGNTRREVAAAEQVGISLDEARRREQLRLKAGEKIERKRVKTEDGRWIAGRN